MGYKICFLYNVTIHPSHSTNQESGADTLRMEELIGLLQSLLYKISNLNSNHGILMNLGFHMEFTPIVVPRSLGANLGV